jgi:hypothetical protein
MRKTKTLDRRQFTAEAALAMLSGVAITISGCGGSSPTAPSGGGGGGGGNAGGPPTNGVVGSISANHDHTVSISQADLDAGNALSLTLTTGDGHTHSLSLTAGQVDQIADGQRVSESSSNEDAHAHSVTFN